MNLKIGIQREIYQVRKWKRIIDYLTSPQKRLSNGKSNSCIYGITGASHIIINIGIQKQDSHSGSD